MKWQLNKRILFASSVLAVLWIGIGAKQVLAQQTSSLTLDFVLEPVARNNAMLKAARASWEAMKARVPQARAWEDPKFGVDIERMGTTSLGTYTGTEWMLSQELPISGRNKWRGKAAEAAAAGAFHELRRKELELAGKARMAYWKLAGTTEQLRINRESVELLKMAVTNTRSKYEVGTRMLADVLMAESELSMIEEGSIDLEQAASDATSQLNVLMHRPPQTALGTPARPMFTILSLDLPAMQTHALAHRPDVLVAKMKIERAEAELATARRLKIPDVEFRVEARSFAGEKKEISEFDTGFFINLPWFNRKKYKSAVIESQEMLEMARQEMEALKVEVLGMVKDHLKKISTLEHHVRLFQGKIVPLADQAVSAMQIAYEKDKASLLELLQAQRAARDAHSMYWHHLMEYSMATGELESLVGTTPIAPSSPPK